MRAHARELAVLSNPSLYDSSERKEWEGWRDYHTAIDFLVEKFAALPNGAYLPSVLTIHCTQYDSKYEIDVEATRKLLASIVKKLGTCEKRYTDYSFEITKRIGSARLVFQANRQVMCKEVVTGTEVVPAQPERVIEKKEWTCEKVTFLGLDDE